MYNRLNDDMLTNNIFVPKQFCFRQGMSAENGAFKLPNSLLKSVNQNMHVGGIFCDLAKAFCSVNHEILLAKLCCMTFKEQFLNSSGPILHIESQKLKIV